MKVQCIAVQRPVSREELAQETADKLMGRPSRIHLDVARDFVLELLKRGVIEFDYQHDLYSDNIIVRAVLYAGSRDELERFRPRPEPLTVVENYDPSSGFR